MYKHKTCDKRAFPKRTMICTAYQFFHSRLVTCFLKIMNEPEKCFIKTNPFLPLARTIIFVLKGKIVTKIQIAYPRKYSGCNLSLFTNKIHPFSKSALFICKKVPPKHTKVPVMGVPKWQFECLNQITRIHLYTKYPPKARVK